MDRTLIFLIITAIFISVSFIYSVFTIFGPAVTQELCEEGGGSWETGNRLCLCGTDANYTCPEEHTCALRDSASANSPGYCIPLPSGLFNTTFTNPENLIQCESDSDCVPFGCCHPSMCVTLDFPQPDCSEIACTMECQPDTLDCGQGRCACIEGKCETEFLDIT